MSTMMLNGQRVVSGSVSIPMYGTWVADVVLANPDDIATSCVLTIGDLELHGTVFRMASFSGSRSARIVGGAGGWRNVLPERGYSQLGGILASLVLQDAAREAGESIVIDSDHIIGPLWAREGGKKAEATLRLITGGQWWIDPAGVTQTGVRNASIIGSTFTAVAWSGGKGQFEIATEVYADWMPGRTFNASTIGTVQTISMVRYEATNEGKIRLIILSTASQTDRALGQIRELIRSELTEMHYCAEWEYAVAPRLPIDPGISSKLDLMSTDTRMPDLTSVPLAAGLVQSTPAAGTRCRVRFVNADPGRPEVISLGDATEHVMTAEACSLLIYNVFSELFTLAGGGPLLGVVLMPLLAPAIIAALGLQGAPAPPGFIAQTAASLAQLGNFASGLPATTSAPFNAAITAIAAKTLNVSGFFPGIGVPYGS